MVISPLEQLISELVTQPSLKSTKVQNLDFSKLLRCQTWRKSRTKCSLSGSQMCNLESLAFFWLRIIYGEAPHFSLRSQVLCFLLLGPAIFVGWETANSCQYVPRFTCFIIFPNLIVFPWIFISTGANLVQLCCKFAPLRCQFDACLVLVWCHFGATLMQVSWIDIIAPILLTACKNNIGEAPGQHQTSTKLASNCHQSGTKVASNEHQTGTKLALVDLKFHEKSMRFRSFWRKTIMTCNNFGIFSRDNVMSPMRSKGHYLKKKWEKTKPKFDCQLWTCLWSVVLVPQNAFRAQVYLIYLPLKRPFSAPTFFGATSKREQQTWLPTIHKSNFEDPRNCFLRKRNCQLLPKKWEVQVKGKTELGCHGPKKNEFPTLRPKCMETKKMICNHGPFFGCPSREEEHRSFPTLCQKKWESQVDKNKNAWVPSVV